MNFFDYIKNDAFFKPLTSKYRRIYYDCIQILIDKTKELPVLYETDARDCITLYLNNSDIQSEMEKLEEDGLNVVDDNETEENGKELQPGMILALFRSCGWVLPREIGRNGEYVTNIATDCRRFMDFLRKMTEKTGEGLMSNRIFAMYEIMKSAFDEESVRKDRPYTNILIPMIDNETELKNELTDLKDSIASIMKAVITFQDINSFGQFIMKDQMLDRFFSEYFFVKNNGLIPTQISYIRGKLRLLKEEEFCNKIIVECAEKIQVPMEEAQERVERYFSELQYFLSVEYEDNMELIDRKINNYYNLANTRIMLMASNGMQMESVLNDFLYVVSKLPKEQQDMAMEKVAGCTQIMNQKYVGRKSFERYKRVKGEGQNIGINISELSEEEKRVQTESIFQNAVNRYSVDRVGNFLDVQLYGKEKISLKETVIQTKEELLMYAAAMLYARNEEFPYDVVMSEEIVKMEMAEISNIVITRR
ncbi:MAG: DUF5716 family protein [Lachnospiraceae bacterium]|nr:DUF5716 family protein [Lachnospiraceae bacterium]